MKLGNFSLVLKPPENPSINRVKNKFPKVFTRKIM